MVSKGAVKHFTIEELRASAADALGTSPGYVIKIPNGEPIFIPHPMFLDEEKQEQLELIQSDDDSGNIALAKAVLGETEHKRYLAAGGQSNDITAAWAVMGQEMTDKVPGSKNPTRSLT